MKLREYLLTRPVEITFDLLSEEEDHNIATFEENPLYTWNIDFQEEWKDIYSAQITRHRHITENYEEIVIAANADRVEEFQFIIAGYCSEKYYDEHHLEVN